MCHLNSSGVTWTAKQWYFKSNSHESHTIEFYKSLPKYIPQLVLFATRKVSLTGYDYKLEQLFSKTKYTKEKTRFSPKNLRL
jgi:hypothetical protein